mmetsp:Transcript_14247/g.49363  ORF Transcript_14247/g.49363 Transcript_14247/m.49363 type:complete len:196 (-) Transcript_14247:9-596(-)
MPTAVPTSLPSPVPTSVPTAVPSAVPTSLPTAAPSGTPTPLPTSVPSPTPTSAPTSVPTQLPSISSAPTGLPTSAPSSVPTVIEQLWTRCFDFDAGADSCRGALEKCFSCVACCDAAASVMEADAINMKAYECAAEPALYGSQCGTSGHFICGCKSTTVAQCEAACENEPWAQRACGQCEGRYRSPRAPYSNLAS